MQVCDGIKHLLQLIAIEAPFSIYNIQYPITSPAVAVDHLPTPPFSTYHDALANLVCISSQSCTFRTRLQLNMAVLTQELYDILISGCMHAERYIPLLRTLARIRVADDGNPLRYNSMRLTIYQLNSFLTFRYVNAPDSQVTGAHISNSPCK